MKFNFKKNSSQKQLSHTALFNNSQLNKIIMFLNKLMSYPLAALVVFPLQASKETIILTPMTITLFAHGNKDPLYSHRYDVDTDICLPIQLFAEALFFSPEKIGQDIPRVQLTLPSIDYITFKSTKGSEPPVKLQQSPNLATILKQENFSDFLSKNRISLGFEVEVSIHFQKTNPLDTVDQLFKDPQLQRLYETAFFIEEGNKRNILEQLQMHAPKEWQSLRQIILQEESVCSTVVPQEPSIIPPEPIVTIQPSPPHKQNKCQDCLALNKNIKKLKQSNNALRNYFNLNAKPGYNLRK